MSKAEKLILIANCGNESYRRPHQILIQLRALKSMNRNFNLIIKPNASVKFKRYTLDMNNLFESHLLRKSAAKLWPLLAHNNL